MNKSKQLIFRWIIYMAGVFVLHVPVMAQISDGGIPPSFQYVNTLRSRSATVQAPVNFDVRELIQADERRQEAQGSPILAVATLIDMDLNPSNSGDWSTLPDGVKLWQMHLEAKDAVALMVYYRDFYIPEGGKLFIYNAEKTQILGAYTQRTNPAGGRFASEFVAGDNITFEYAAGADGAMPRIDIEAIGYGYNHLTVNDGQVSLRASSGTCEVNVNCEEGDAWQNQKKGVVLMSQKIAGTTYICSGSLVNNTAQDLKPYILSAYHCSCDANNVQATPEEMKQWVFYFHYELEGCDVNSKAVTAKSIVGCSKVAETTLNGQSDGLLLLANTSIPADYNVYYNGWDRRNTPAQSGVSIHHPQGDYKKISTFTSPAGNYSFVSEKDRSDTNAHWNVTFAETVNGHGITEDGSSGSPLFNENKLIVGTLSGGNSACNYLEGLNLYGKFSYHWNKYSNTDTTRFDIWLDPTGSGVEFLPGRFNLSQTPAPQNLRAVYQNQTVRLTWQAPTQTKPLKYFIYNNNVRLGETTTLSFSDTEPQYGMRTYSVSAVYEADAESNFANVSIEIVEYKPPVNVSIAYTSAQQQVALQWEQPVYEQTIYWGERAAMYQVSLNKTIPFYFGQKWTPDDISLFHRKTITSVKFIPIRNNSYEIFISQGDRTYSQAVSAVVNGETNTVTLETPFVIDGAQELIVSVYVSKHSPNASEYPAVCDGGPAVQGKGNIYSFDGVSWENLEDIENPDDYNFNFFIAAVVSSIEKDIPVTTSRGEVVQGSRFKVQGSRFDVQGSRSKVQGSMFDVQDSNPVSLRSVRPTTFPAVTGYRVYRDNVRVASVASAPTRFLDKAPTRRTSYQVSAMYGTEEGERSAAVSLSPVDNIQIESNDVFISPVIFTNQVEISGYELVSRIEVYSATGQQVLQINRPERVIHTESLRPGIYFFRIYTVEGFKVVKGVRR
ncbi:MAG: T9SS type A sorting domain-containing protein [Tannerella sp.]|jgi:hypothetical protein|nr:T9SS type A sorting domain-containing protein [Tannerella sp.]